MAEMKTVYTKDAAFRTYSPSPPLPSHQFPSPQFPSHQLTPPPAAGPYSQAIATATTIYCSGQIPCTSSGEILTLPTSTLAQMTELCIQNLSAVLKAAGSGISRVVKVNVFLTSMDGFAEMNGVVSFSSSLLLSPPPLYFLLLLPLSFFPFCIDISLFLDLLYSSIPEKIKIWIED